MEMAPALMQECNGDGEDALRRGSDWAYARSCLERQNSIFPRTFRQGLSDPTPVKICTTSRRYPSTARFLMINPFSTSISTWTQSENIWRFGMGSETLDRSGARVSQEQKYSHFPMKL